ncbi:MAG: hypothetical protein L0G57_04190 [Acinetobacter sp.]|nr:hypothetical protein [Acinetobacter sp.]
MVKSEQIVNLLQEQPLSPYMDEQYNLFRKSYDSRGGHKTYTARPSAFMGFFHICDQQWGKIPSLEVLQTKLTNYQLQRAMPVFKWLVKKGHIEADEIFYEKILIQGAVQETLASFGEQPPTMLQSYLDYLNEKFDKQEITQKSIRGFLQPPMYLYHRFELKGSQTPSQWQIERYLKEHKGSRSLISTFVKFLNRFHGTNLICKVTKKKKPPIPNPNGGYDFVNDKDRKISEDILIELGQLSSVFDDAQKIAWINHGIKYFHRHDINIQNLDEVIIQASRESMKLMVVKHYEASFPLPRFLNQKNVHI